MVVDRCSLRLQAIEKVVLGDVSREVLPAAARLDCPFSEPQVQLEVVVESEMSCRAFPIPGLCSVCCHFGGPMFAVGGLQGKVDESAVEDGPLDPQGKRKQVVRQWMMGLDVGFTDPDADLNVCLLETAPRCLDAAVSKRGCVDESLEGGVKRGLDCAVRWSIATLYCLGAGDGHIVELSRSSIFC